MTFGAQQRFRARPTVKGAGHYLSETLTAEVNDEIEDDAFLDALSEIANWLVKQ